jgi:hypothetical protein
MSSDINMPIYKKQWFWIVVLAFLLIVTTIIIGYTLVNSYEKEREKSARATICKILTDKSRMNSFMPDVLVINVNDSDKKLVFDSISKRVSDHLLEKYTNGNDDDDSKINFYPYVSFLEKASSKPINQGQIDELKKYISFLVSNVDKAVEESRRNIDTEISKVNTWVTIWIGIFGIFGIFIPILVNIKSFDTLKEIQSKANSAEETINNHKDDLKAISGIKEDVKKAKEDIDQIDKKLPSLTEQSSDAVQKAKDAIDKSEINNKMIIAFNAIGKLKKLEKIVLLNRKNPIPTIHSHLTAIKKILATIDRGHHLVFYLDLLEELKDRLMELVSSTVIKERSHTLAISTFAIFLNNKCEQETPLTAEDHAAIIAQFELMLNQLNISA